MTSIFIKKANGEEELFDIDKLKKSLRRSGANENLIEKISQQVESELKSGAETKEIYRKAFSLLRKKEKLTAAKYSTRRSIMDLGPNGFPFEDFVGEIFRAKGYRVEVGKTIDGFCVLHELDVVADNKTEIWTVEAKFHNSYGIRSDLKTVLYIQARFEDIKKGKFFKKIDKKGKKKKMMLITNTKFTSKAIQYGNCAGLFLVGWNYPEKGNLQDLIEETKLHPLTSLISLTKKQKKSFLNQGIVLCRDLKGGGKSILKMAGIPESKFKIVLEEVEKLC